MQTALKCISVTLDGCFILTMSSLFTHLYHYLDVFHTSPDFHANSLHSRFLHLGFSTYYGVMCTPIEEMGVFSSNPAHCTIYGHWTDCWLTAGSSCWVAQTWRRIQCNWGFATELREFSSSWLVKGHIKWYIRRGQCVQLKRTLRGSKERPELSHTSKMEKCIAV